MDTTNLAHWLGSAYALDGPVTCRLLRAYTNDVYFVDALSRKFVLKLYGVGWRTQAEIEYEAALLDHLARKGLQVAEAILGRDSRKVHALPAPMGGRYAVLFAYAAGEKPQPPFSIELYFAFGQAIARMHALSNDFVTQYERRPLDLSCILDAPLKLTLPLLEKEEDRVSLQCAADAVKSGLAKREFHSLDWGPIHGDATLDNLHVTQDGGIVLYDFDSGGPGWRAADLQGWAKNKEEFAGKWQAFRNGYASVRELKASDLEAAPYLALAWLIWGLQIDLEQRILKQGSEKTTDYLAMQIGRIKQEAAELL